MDIHRQIQDLVNKLSNPFWMTGDVRSQVKNFAENEGRLNIAWVLNGRPEVITQAFFDSNLDNWFLAHRIGEARVDNIPAKEYATLFSEAEFYDFVCEHPKIFERFLPMKVWRQKFTGKVRK